MNRGMWILARSVAVCAGLFAGACASSPPVEYLTLDVVRPPAGAPAAPIVAGPPLAVGRVSLPPELDRSALVRRVGGHRLEVDEGTRWPAPLDELVRRTLAFDLAARMASRRVVLPGEPRPVPAPDVLVLSLGMLAAGPGGRFVLDGRWSLVGGEGRREVLAHAVHLEAELASASGPDTARALSELIGQLADEVAAALAGAGR